MFDISLFKKNTVVSLTPFLVIASLLICIWKQRSISVILVWGKKNTRSNDPLLLNANLYLEKESQKQMQLKMVTLFAVH